MIPGIGHNSVRGVQRVSRLVTDHANFTGIVTDLVINIGSYDIGTYLAVTCGEFGASGFSQVPATPTIDGTTMELAFTVTQTYSSDGHRGGIFLHPIRNINRTVKLTTTTAGPLWSVWLLRGINKAAIHHSGKSTPPTPNVTVDTTAGGIAFVVGVRSFSGSLTAVSNTDREHYGGASTTTILAVDDVTAASNTEYACTYTGFIGLTMAASFNIT